MIKISLRHPTGLEIAFEGDEQAFDRFAQFLAGELSGFVHGLEPANNGDSLALPPAGTDTGGDDSGDTGEPEHLLLANGEGMSPHAVAEMIERVGAKSDIDRVTVIAHAAVQAGMEGIDYATIDRLYGDMGLPKPTRFAKAFSNARSRGLVKSVKHGVWATTVQGENYARYGQKPPRRPQRRSSSSPGGPPPTDERLLTEGE